MNNGTRKGGEIEAFETLESSPGLEDLWQLHWSYNGMLEHNAPSRFIANVEDAATTAALIASPAAPSTSSLGSGNAAHTPAYWIKVSAQQDGTFTVTNARNGFSKTYKPRS
jgi:hypothetical protein